jgi:hypothetical protein
MSSRHAPANTANAGWFLNVFWIDRTVADELFYFSHGDFEELEARGLGGHHGLGSMIGGGIGSGMVGGGVGGVGGVGGGGHHGLGSIIGGGSGSMIGGGIGGGMFGGGVGGGVGLGGVGGGGHHGLGSIIGGGLGSIIGGGMGDGMFGGIGDVGGHKSQRREEEELWARRFVYPLMYRLGCTDTSLHPSLSFYGDFDELE